jgi:hypothetical protein
MATVLTASEKRKRLKLKRIVVSERNYLALKMLGHAGRIQSIAEQYKEMQKEAKKLA